LHFKKNNIIYLDPHKVQSALKPDVPIDSNTYQTYKCKVPQMIPMQSLDPSIAIGIFCRTKVEFFEFVADQQAFRESGSAMMFSVGTVTPDYLQDAGKIL